MTLSGVLGLRYYLRLVYRKRLTLIYRYMVGALVALFVVPGTAIAASHASKTEVSARHSCARGHVISCIHRAALHYRIDYAQAKFIAFRESRYHPGVCNPQPVSDGEHACGLYQFIPSTWASTPYGRAGRSVFSAKWAALGYAWEIAHGGSGNWGF